MGVNSFTDRKIVQYYALYCIYCATNAVPNPITTADKRFANITVFPGWLVSTGWTDNNTDPCSGTWFGVDCDGDNVTVLDLFQNVLTGYWPAEVDLLAGDGSRSTGAGSLYRIDLFMNEFLFNNFDLTWITYLGSNFCKSSRR